MLSKQDIKALSKEELAALMQELGEPKFRAKQLEKWLYANSCLHFDDMTDLPAALRDELDNRFFISSPSLIERQVSSDGTRKYLLEFSDGKSVETVGIPSEDGSRLTVCVSTQVGCPMGCSFCATGKSGFTRNLSSGEIFDQVRYVSEDFGRRVSNVVFMGQGEPFLNYENVISALQRLNFKDGPGIGSRHMTVSTCGIPEGLENFMNEPEQYTLAVSLHSAVQGTRDALMPRSSNVTIDELKDLLKNYGDKTKRRPSVEFALIDGVNDTDEEIEALIEFCKGMLCHVNLIELNPISDESADTYTLNPSDKAQKISEKLTAHGIENSVRRSRGADIDGACGQLKQRKQS